MRADALGFFDLEGRPPIADPNLDLRLVHVTSCHPQKETLSGISTYHKGFAKEVRSQTGLKVVRSRTGMLHLQDGETGVIFGLQNPPQDAIAAEWMSSQDIVFTTLAYNKPGAYGSGYYDEKGGLTERGKLFIEACSVYDVAVDLSHASARTALDAISFVKDAKLGVRLVITHAGIRELCDNPRNLPLEVFKEVVLRGGFVGIPMFMFFLQDGFNEMENEGLVPLIRHLESAIWHCGEDAVCIGSDTPYRQYDLDDHRVHFRRMAKELDPDGKTLQGVRMPELQHNHRYYSPHKMRLVEAELNKFFSPRVVDKLVGENFWNWCLQNLPE